MQRKNCELLKQKHSTRERTRVPAAARSSLGEFNSEASKDGKKPLKRTSGQGVRLDKDSIWMKYQPEERGWNLELVLLNNPIISVVFDFIKNNGTE